MAPINFVQKLPTSPRPQTPPSSPELLAHKQMLSSEHVQMFVDLLKAAIQTAPAATGANQPLSTDHKPVDKTISRAWASKQEFKRVNETWNEKEYKYKIIKSITPSEEVDELDEYVFVVRVRIGEYTELYTIPRH